MKPVEASSSVDRDDWKRLLRLVNPIRNYPWGSTTLIPGLAGREPSGKPEAELWIGAHPAAPSRVELGDREVRLDELVALRPLDLLGAEALSRGGPAFPFLLKILAAAKPLSIQTHPSAEQARGGFERENREHLDVSDPRRCYRDPLAKNELVCAFSGQFPVLSGFRPRDESLESLRALDAEALAPWIARLATGHPAEGYRYFLGELLAAKTLPLDRDILHRLSTSDLPEHRWTATLEDHFPGDPMALAPLFLHLVELAPGQALATTAGTLHSYLEGIAIELMTPSDNVLRGGLTSKHVDRPELLRILRFEAAKPEVLEPEARDMTRTYTIPGESDGLELALDWIELEGAQSLRIERRDGVRDGVEVLLATSGLAEAQAPDQAPMLLGAGQALLVPAAVEHYRLAPASPSEPMTVFRARTVLEPESA